MILEPQVARGTDAERYAALFHVSEALSACGEPEQLARVLGDQLRGSGVDAPVPNQNGTHDEISRIVRETISEISKGNTRSAAKEHDEKERQEIMRVLRETKGRVGGAGGAAERMAVNRTTLISRMKKFGIDPRLFA